jgi:hypothetical protein
MSRIHCNNIFVGFICNMLFQNYIIFFTFYIFSFFLKSNGSPINHAFNRSTLGIKHKEHANDSGIKKNDLSIRAQLILKGEYNVSSALRLHVIWPNVVSTLTQCRRDQILVASVTPKTLTVNFFILKSALPHAQNINTIYEKLNEAILRRDKKFVSLIMKPYNIKSAELKKQSVTNGSRNKTVSKKKKNDEEVSVHTYRRQEKPHITPSLKKNKTLTETKQTRTHSDTVVDLNQLNFNSLNSTQPALPKEALESSRENTHSILHNTTNLWKQLQERNVTAQEDKFGQKKNAGKVSEKVVAHSGIIPSPNQLQYPLTVTVLPLEKNVFQKLSALQNVTLVLPQQNNILQQTSTGSRYDELIKSQRKVEKPISQPQVKPNDDLIKDKEILPIDPRLYNTSIITADDSYIDKTAKLLVNTIKQGKPKTESVGTRLGNDTLQDSWAPLAAGLASLFYNAPA